VQSYLLNPFLLINELNPFINKKELLRVLLALNWSFSEFHSKCLSDLSFCIVAAARIAIKASRQGSAMELYILNGINNYTKNFGVYVTKPKKPLCVYNNVISTKQPGQVSLFRSLDGVISGKMEGFIFCKVIVGSNDGPAQYYK
jgi:hypothetical protein